VQLLPNGELAVYCSCHCPSWRWRDDSTRVYAHARVAQTLLQRPFSASRSSTNCAIQIARQPWPNISNNCFQHEADSWQEREQVTLQLFLTLRLSAP
jgi:hypothetical protein